jgi:hypothetical protein
MKLTHYAFLLTLLCSLGINTASAEAFCALRDPVSSIYTLYPSATAYQSIVRTVNSQTREHIITHLPHFNLHFSEMGRHTLYVALQDGRKIGYVHMRSEQSQWGLVEVAWALNLDLSVKDFVFQRARNPSRKFLETPSFKSQLSGRNFNALQTLLHSPFAEFSAPLFTDKDALQLASVVVKSAMKTLLITEQAWREDLHFMGNEQ